MNDQWGYEEDMNGTDLGSTHSDGPKALRDAYAAMKKQNDELNAKLTGFLEEQNKQKLATVFQSLGAPGAENLYQGEADPEKARVWVESMRGVFGGNNAQGQAPVADSIPAHPGLEAPVQEQFQRMTEAGQSGTPTGNMDAAQASIGDASNINDLIAAFDRMNRM
jgi:hypothetical protein